MVAMYLEEVVGEWINLAQAGFLKGQVASKLCSLLYCAHRCVAVIVTVRKAPIDTWALLLKRIYTSCCFLIIFSH